MDRLGVSRLCPVDAGTPPVDAEALLADAVLPVDVEVLPIGAEALPVGAEALLIAVAVVTLERAGAPGAPGVLPGLVVLGVRRL